MRFAGRFSCAHGMPLQREGMVEVRQLAAVGTGRGAGADHCADRTTLPSAGLYLGWCLTGPHAAQQLSTSGIGGPVDLGVRSSRLGDRGGVGAAYYAPPRVMAGSLPRVLAQLHQRQVVSAAGATTSLSHPTGVSPCQRLNHSGDLAGMAQRAEQMYRPLIDD